MTPHISSKLQLLQNFLCCSVDCQGQGKAQGFASKVQHWAFLVSQQNPLDKLVDMACIWVDTDIREIPGAPVYLHSVTALEKFCELLLLGALLLIADCTCAVV